MKHAFIVSAAIAGVMLSGSARATVVASSLPYLGTPDWSDVVFSGTSMGVVGSEAILTTADNRGVWFGWSAGLNPPAWNMAANNLGNYLSLTTKFSAGSDDWSAYMHDGTRQAAMIFNESLLANGSPCDASFQNCYNFGSTPGVSLYFAGVAPNSFIRTFIALDTTQYATYEWLLLGNTVTYRINGVAYSGTALPTASSILVIGDGSGSSRSGTGQMRVSGVSFDRAPAFSNLPSTVTPGVPEPASWAMLIAGFGLVGATLRRRRALFA
jgi:hypothetical protein